MAILNVGIGEYQISRNPEDIVKTYALGSCVAVVVYDKKQKIGGMIHIALPESNIDKEKAQKFPGYFADSGIPVFFREILQGYGANRGALEIKLIGGAAVMDLNGVFDIGKRNVLAIRKLLWKNNLLANVEDVGGDYSRTVSIFISTGEVWVSSKDKKWQI